MNGLKKIVASSAVPRAPAVYGLEPGDVLLWL